MGDVLSGGPGRPPWRPPRRLVVAASASALAAALVAGVVAVGGSDDGGAVPRSPAPASPAGSPFPDGPDAAVAAGQTPGLVITGMPLPKDATLIRHDRTALAGPWTVVVRRAGGSLGRNGAVVTFPVPAPAGGRPVRVGDASGRAREHEITWPVAGSYARVRGDLPRTDLIAVAAATGVASGRPAVDPPPGLTVVSRGPSRPGRLLEARYSSKATGESEALSGGLTFTGVARCGGLEDGLYAAPVRTAGTVHGRPAVVASGVGGNGALVWEPTPGVVAYVGYSGATLDDAAVAALRRLAARTRLLTPAQWRATAPATSDQANDLDPSA
ncbi:hypothetical protein [Streptomyces sp. NPDC048481]|uniref:hypothetical protein n=1 Tax=Streptomyces sp. NPDC048481 TaxID=3365557 RepID=UPI0037181CAD